MRLIAGRHFNVVDVPGDGSCLFHALSLAFYGSDSMAPAIREEVVQHVFLNWETFWMETEDASGVPFEDKEIYKSVMLFSSSYGAGAEIRASSEIFHRKVRVYSINSLVHEFSPDVPGVYPIAYLLHHQNHYQYLEPVDLMPSSCESNEDSSESSSLPDEGSDELSDLDDCDLLTAPPSDPEPSLNVQCRYSSLERPKKITKPFPVFYTCKPSIALTGGKFGDFYMWALRFNGEVCQGTEPLQIGHMDAECPYSLCRARYWQVERLCGSLTEVPYWCCGKSIRNHLTERGVFKPIEDPDVRELYYGNSERALHFRRHCRAYNYVLSPGVQSAKHDGVQVFHERTLAINGKVTHKAPSAPDYDRDGIPKNHGQLYFVDMSENTIGRRIQASTDKDLRPDIVLTLETYLRNKNPLVQTFELAGNMFREKLEAGDESGASELCLMINPHREGFRTTDRELFVDDRNCTRPANSEFVAAVYTGLQPNYSYDVAVYPRARTPGQPRYYVVNEASPCLDNLLYPLIHLHGEESWLETEVEIDAATGLLKSKRRRDSDKTWDILATLKSYYSARVMRRGELNPDVSFRVRGLWQQYLCDAAVKIEDSNLRYFEANHEELMACTYDNLKRYLEDIARDQSKDPGRVVVIPKNRQRSERRLYDNYMDAVTIASKTRPPALFITMTCNPRWPEIVQGLAEIGLKAEEYVHAPDLCVRAFMARLNVLKSAIINKGIFGRVLSYVGVHEFTTTNLPHYHMTVMLHPADEPTTAEHVDAMVSAEIPNPEQEPALYKLVLGLMIHKPCNGEVPGYVPTCLKDGKCKHNFPFELREETIMTRRGPILRRRNTGKIWHPKFRCYVDNRWVVPFPMMLLILMACHVCLLVCGRNIFFKYLFGYMQKEAKGQHVQGSMLKYVKSTTDKAVHWDEIEHHRAMRFIGSYEAVYHILSVAMTDMSHSVQTLPIHLPGKQCLYYGGRTTDAATLQENTQLLMWFQMNADNNPETKDKYYVDIVKTHTWTSKSWKRKTGPSTTLGRLMPVNPSPRNMELFHLRVLLMNCQNVTSFQDLLTVDGVLYDTFNDACIALGLNDSSKSGYGDALDEVVTHGSAWQIRSFFAVIVTMCNVTNVNELWIKHRDKMSEGFFRMRLPQDEAFARARLSILRKVVRLIECEKEASERAKAIEGIRTKLTLCDIFTDEEYVPSADDDSDHIAALVENDDGRDEVIQIIDEGHQEVRVGSNGDEVSAAQHHAHYTDEQRIIHDLIISAIDSKRIERGGFFFLSAPAGCGKTHLYNGLIKALHARGLQSKACAFTALAATLLIDGDTVHKTFGIPVKGRTTGVERSHIENISEDAESLRMTSLIVIDEVSMIAQWQIKLIDELLRHVMGKPDNLFGGKIVLLGGDMGQILPVMRGLPLAAVSAHSLPAWEHWCQRKELRLTLNFRAREDPEYAQWLSKVRDGSANVFGTDFIYVPPAMLVEPSADFPRKRYKSGADDFRLQEDSLIHSIVEKVYGDLSSDKFRDNIIMAPTNDVVERINNIVMNRLPGTGVTKTYLSYTELCLLDQPRVRRFAGGECDVEPEGGANGRDEAVGNQVVNDAAGGFLMAREELEGVKAANIPPHRLHLRVGSIVMLLKNMNKPQGLCNGTRFAVIQMLQQVVKLRRLIPFKGQCEELFMPKMWLRSDDVAVAGSIERFQFPIAPAFCITINKSQGQTFNTVGLFLRRPVFSHGQLYVALSRGKKKKDVFVAVVPGPQQGQAGMRFGGRGNLSRVRTLNIVDTSLL